MHSGVRGKAARYTATVLIMLAGVLMTYTDDAAADAATLRARHDELLDVLAHNVYQQPLYIESGEVAGKVHGDVYARLDHPFSTVATALARPTVWCDILLLHLNTKFCRASQDNRGSVVSMHLGRKFEQPLEDTHRVDLSYRVAATTPDYLEVRLEADQGPLSTRDYRIGLEAIPLEDGTTFLHFTYAYAYGLSGRLAMKAYLATLGRNKIGFSTIGKKSSGQPQHVDGTLGAAERNTMRYFLAIESFLNALSAPPQERMEKSLRNWFAATERYPRQLHEIDLDDYLVMKRHEYARQQAGVPVNK